MSKVTAQFTMSLDGFIAGPNDGVESVIEKAKQGVTHIRFQVVG